MAKIYLRMLNKVELVGNKGATLEILDNTGKALGRLRLGRAGLTYIKPGPGPKKGTTKSWADIVSYF